jgi:hypothetical protein
MAGANAARKSVKKRGARNSKLDFVTGYQDQLE